jgi:hypothetical protein
VSLIRLGNGDDATFAEANFSNYHAGINYLVQKYGSQRVNEAFAGPKFSPDRLELEAGLNEHGREKLKPRPGAKRHDTFGAKNLREMEAIITGGGGSDVKESDVLGIALALGSTAASAAQFAMTLDVNAAISTCQAALKTLNAVHTTGKGQAALAVESTAASIAQFALTLDANAAINAYDAASKALSAEGALTGDALLACERASSAQSDKTVPLPKILSESEKLVYHTDKKMIARENFQNFYAGMKYLVAKYGVESIPGDLMDELITLSKELQFVMEGDRALLPDQPPNGAREKPFSQIDLGRLENLITGKNKAEVAMAVLKIAAAALGTAAAVTGAVATFGAGAPAIPAAIGALISLIMTAKSDIETAVQIANMARRT